MNQAGLQTQKVRGLEEHGLMAGPKPLLKESGIHHRLQNCYAFLLAKGVQALQMFEIMKTRNYGPSGLRCSLRLLGYIISIMYGS